MTEELPAQLPKTLYADDVAANRRYLKGMLERLGFETQLAEDGNSALTLWQQDRHPLVLLDINMPGMDGAEVAEGIRQAQREDETVVILGITADMTETLRTSMKMAGMNDCINKPTNAQDLRALLIPWLDQDVHNLTAPESEHRNLILGDPELLQQLMQELPQDLEALQQAFTDQDHAAARAIAHRISGVAAMYRLAELSVAIQRLQQSMDQHWPVPMDALEAVNNAMAEDLVELQSNL